MKVKLNSQETKLIWGSIACLFNLVVVWIVATIHECQDYFGQVNVKSICLITNKKSLSKNNEKIIEL